MGEISERLKAIAGEVRLNATVADIGCDHGLTDIYIVKQKICQRAVAMDVRREPLRRAGENIISEGLENKIETRLSDGFESILPGEAETAIISGMGGILIKKILSADPEKTGSFTELVLSPQSDVALVRRFLSDTEFLIDRERMVKDSGKYYNIIHALNTKKVRVRAERYLSDMDMDYGRYLILHRDPVFLEYIMNEKEKAEKILRSLSGALSEAGIKRKGELLHIIKQCDIILSSSYEERS